MHWKNYVGLSLAVGIITLSKVDAADSRNKKTSIVAKPSLILGCPNYQYSCPDCGDGEECAYPDSGGCAGAGIPYCKPVDCLGLQCLIKAEPCPDECPFSCTYGGPSCCPLLGTPVCKPPCNTFAPCAVTPCPKNCKGDCFYPDADYCCPLSGKAVCRNSFTSLASTVITPTPITPILTLLPPYTTPFPESTTECIVDTDSDKPNGHHNGKSTGRQYPIDTLIDPQTTYSNSYLVTDKGRKNSKSFFTDDILCSDATVTQTVTEISVVTTTVMTDDPILCIDIIIPCPEECPDTCTYPLDHPCPYTQQPTCPIPDTCLIDPVTTYSGGNTPYFPSEPVPITPVPTTPIPTSTTITPVVCPLIIFPCPPECPDSCLRPDVPCPYAVEPYCPGKEPCTGKHCPSHTKKHSLTPTITPTILPCPLIEYACPLCLPGYTCERATTGSCPNTNIPYCTTSTIPTIYTDPIYTPSVTSIGPTIITDPIYTPSVTPLHSSSAHKGKNKDKGHH